MNTNFKIKKGNFTTTFNDIFKVELNGEKLKPECWGLYVFMLSLPEDWDYSINGLAKIVNAGKDKIQRILNELIEAGFIIRTQKNEDGRFGNVEYLILDQPNSTAETDANKEASFFEPPHPGFPDPENPLQQNTKEQIIYIDKYKIKGENLSVFYPPSNYHYLTQELITKKFISAIDDAYDLESFNELFKELDLNNNYLNVVYATRYVVDWFFRTKPKIKNKFKWFAESVKANVERLESKCFYDINKRIDALLNKKPSHNDEPEWLDEIITSYKDDDNNCSRKEEPLHA